MASATGINIGERTREIGVMKAIGTTPKMIYSLFVTVGYAHQLRQYSIRNHHILSP